MAKAIVKLNKKYKLFDEIVTILTLRSFDEIYEVEYTILQEKGIYIGTLEDIKQDFEETV